MNYRERLNEVLEELKLKANIIACRTEGPFVVFDLALHSGGKFRQIERFSTEIALALRAVAEPLVYPVTSEGVVRMEVMIREQSTVLFEEVAPHADGILPLVLGKTKTGSPFVADLVKMPHVLVGGATGSGKSIMLHSIICGVLGKAQLALIDPKRVEFAPYKRIKGLYAPIAKTTDEAIALLRKLIAEMDKRFAKLEKWGCRDISLCNNKMPYIVVVIDELADLMAAAKKEVQDLLCQLAQKSRACGIHIIAATQRPSVDVVTGLIKANFPARIACRVISNADSRVILDRAGAEKLLGNGDAVIQSSEYDFQRFKGAYLSEEEIFKLTNNGQNWWSRIWNGQGTLKRSCGSIGK